MNNYLLKNKITGKKELKIYQISYFCVGGHHYEHPGKILVVAKNPYESLKKLKRKKPGIIPLMFKRPSDYVRPIEEIIKEDFDENYKIIVERIEKRLNIRHA